MYGVAHFPKKADRIEISLSPYPCTPDPVMKGHGCTVLRSSEKVLRNAGKVVSRTMIMEHVWDYNFDPMTKVVEARIYKLRDKIDKDHDTKLLHTVWGAGYVLKETT